MCESADHFRNEAAFALHCMELEIEHSQQVQDEWILLSSERAPQMIDLLHGGRIQVEDQLKRLQLIERINRGPRSRKRSWIHVVLRKHVLELEEPDGSG